MPRPPADPAIGPALVEARAAGVRWKVLERRFNLCRMQLYRIWLRAVSEGWG